MADVQVKRNQFGKGVFATRSFETGEKVLGVVGPLVKERDIYTIQIAPDLHIAPRSPAKYLNHSCDPNLGVKMNRSGLVYNLSDEDYVVLRKRGVTTQVIDYMKSTYTQALEQFPKIGKDPYYGCWYLGPDGYWYGGGPNGFHPDC